MTGGITEFIQTNDIDICHYLKSCNRNEEMALILKKLEVGRNKVPSPNREQMIEMLLAARKETNVDFVAPFKKFFVTNAFDESEDFLVFDELFSLIGDEMLEY